MQALMLATEKCQRWANNSIFVKDLFRKIFNELIFLCIAVKPERVNSTNIKNTGNMNLNLELV